MFQPAPSALCEWPGLILTSTQKIGCIVTFCSLKKLRLRSPSKVMPLAYSSSISFLYSPIIRCLLYVLGPGDNSSEDKIPTHMEFIFQHRTRRRRACVLIWFCDPASLLAGRPWSELLQVSAFYVLYGTHGATSLTSVVDVKIKKKMAIAAKQFGLVVERRFQSQRDTGLHIGYATRWLCTSGKLA